MCEYYQRLDSQKLQKLDLRLSTCVLALSLMNGDFSLLTPQVYRSPSQLYTDQPNGSLVSTQKSFQWEPTNLLKHASHTVLYPRSICQERPVANLYQLNKDGYTIPGLLWQLDEYIDFSSFKEEYSKEWSDMRRSHKAQQVALAAYPAFYHENVSKKNLLITTHMIFEILNFLKHQNHIEVADAIWQSVFNAEWKIPGSSKTDSVESVLEIFDSPEKLEPEDRVDMFYLQENKDGSCHCWWLIDRIMEKGGLWIGSLARLPSMDVLGLMTDREDFEATMGLARQTGKAKISNEKAYTSAIRRKLGSAMLRLLNQHQVRTDEYASMGESIQPEAISNFAYTTGLLTDYLEGYQNDLFRHRAVFDVDEPFDMVLTPFNSRLEGLPTADLRSMSTSWVVQKIEDVVPLEVNQAEEEAGRKHQTEKYQPLGMVQGMWKVLDPPIWSRFTLV
jgi:hypothetical protein